MNIFTKIEVIAYLVIVFVSAIVNIVLIVKNIYKKKKEGTLNEADIENAKLRVREIVREAIYEAEKKFEPMRAQGIKCGALKLDDVLAKVDNACLREGIAFDKEEITEYVNSEVNKMKGVK